jgi:hypothetical protein
MEFLESISIEILVGFIGTLLGYLGKVGLDFVVKLRRNRAFLRFLNFPKGEIIIVHSALFDPSRASYNYPSCDMISARRIANLLESAGMKEGLDFKVTPEANCLESDGSVNPGMLNHNLILLGGPKRNKVTLDVLQRAAKLRFQMGLDNSGENQLYDDATKNYLISSRDDPDHYHQANASSTDQSIEYDYGLIWSMNNPHHLYQRILLLAGIHGPGTIGTVTYISSSDNLATLSLKREGGVIQAVIQTKYIANTDDIKEISLI